ncbi:TPA: hypothetical protein ACX6PS_002430 [Photobacterium damselae]
MKIFFSILCLVLSFQSYAVNVGSITSFIDSKSDTVVKEIANESKEARLILVKVIEIDEPTNKGTVINNNPKNLLLSPSKVILPADTKEKIKFFYNGPKDDKERYYRIIWTDSNISNKSDKSTSKKKAFATTTAVISTILVVTPRKEEFKYSLSNNVLINQGNSSYHVVAYGQCIKDKKEKCKEDYYDLPGTKRTFKNIDLNDKQSFIGIWHEKNFITVK